MEVSHTTSDGCRGKGTVDDGGIVLGWVVRLSACRFVLSYQLSGQEVGCRADVLSMAGHKGRD